MKTIYVIVKVEKDCLDNSRELTWYYKGMDEMIGVMYDAKPEKAHIFTNKKNANRIARFLRGEYKDSTIMVISVH